MNQSSKFDFLKNKLDTQNSENSSTQNSENLTSQNSENSKSEEIEVKESKTLVGRPKGKRSNPDYIQVTCYIKKGTHKSVKRGLFEIEKEFSELVEELLQKWLANN